MKQHSKLRTREKDPELEAKAPAGVPSDVHQLSTIATDGVRLAIGFLVIVATWGFPRASLADFVNFETPQVHPIEISPDGSNPQISYGGVGTNITANFCGRFIDSPPLFPL